MVAIQNKFYQHLRHLVPDKEDWELKLAGLFTKPTTLSITIPMGKRSPLIVTQKPITQQKF
jgi:hypothetical protein